MATMSTASRTFKGRREVPGRGLTRRFAYDTDEEEDEAPGQVKPNLEIQRDVVPLVNLCQEVARTAPRLTQTARQTQTQLRQAPANARSSGLQQESHRPKPVETSAPFAKKDLDDKTDKATPAPAPADDPDGDWIICRFDYTARWYNGNYGKFRQLPDGHWDFLIAPEQHLYRKPLASTTTKKSNTTFMDLPGELRNKIYGFAIPERTVRILRNHPNKEVQVQKCFWSDERMKLQRPRSRLTHDAELEFTYGEFVDALNLLLTCKEIKSEVETFFYSRVVFYFGSLKTLDMFLHIAPRGGLQAVRRVHIRLDGYGNPDATCNQKYREPYQQRWEKTCARLGQLTPNIEHLKLTVRDREWPTVLSGQEYNPAWAKAILNIAPQGLHKVEVRVRHKMIEENEAVQKDLSRRVEDNMMTQAGRDERDRIETEQVLRDVARRQAKKEEKEHRRLAKLNAPPPRTELVISMEDVQKEAKKTSAVVKKVRNKGLDKFSKVY